MILKTIKNNLTQSKENNFYFLLLLLHLFLLPLYRISSSPFLFFISFLIIINLFRKANIIFTNFYTKKLNLLFFSLFGFVSLSLLYSENLSNGINALKQFLPLIIYPLFFSFYKMKKSQFTILLKAFVLGLLLAFLISISSQFYNYFIGKEYSFFYVKLVDILWMHPAYLSIYLNFGIVVVYVLFQKKEINLFSFLLSILVFLLFIILLSTRTQIVILFIILSSLFVHILRKKFSITALMFSCIFFLFTAYYFFNNNVVFKRFSYVKNLSYSFENENSKAWNGANVRLAIWRCSFDVINKNKFLGVGIGDEDEELFNSYKDKSFHFALKHRYIAHNQFIQFLLSIGGIGLLFYLGILAYLFRYSYLNHSVLLFSLVSMFFITGLFESYLRLQSGIVFFALMISLLVSIKNQKDLATIHPNGKMFERT